MEMQRPSAICTHKFGLIFCKLFLPTLYPLLPPPKMIPPPLGGRGNIKFRQKWVKSLLKLGVIENSKVELYIFYYSKSIKVDKQTARRGETHFHFGEVKGPFIFRSKHLVDTSTTGQGLMQQSLCYFQSFKYDLRQFNLWCAEGPKYLRGPANFKFKVSTKGGYFARALEQLKEEKHGPWVN